MMLIICLFFFSSFCLSVFLHRIYLLQLLCAVLICLSAPYISSAAFLCGALSPLCTVHILHSFPVRCSFVFLHHTHSLQFSCAVLIRPFAPYTSSAAFLCGALSPFCTVHIVRSFHVRCLFAFLHRTYPPQLLCAVLIRHSAPYTSSAAFLCGALLPFCTVHILHSSSVRCSFVFLHHTHSLQFSCAVLIRHSAPYTSSAAFLCGAHSPLCTVHIFRSSSVRCLFALLHRTYPPQFSCAVHFSLSAPYISSTAPLCGALSPLCTVHIVRSSSVQSSLQTFPRPSLFTQQ